MQTQTVHVGPVFSVEVMTWADEQGRPVRRDIVRHPGAVLIIPLLDDDSLVMIRNFRVAIGRKLLEFPAGKLEAGEPPAAAAARELLEETGYRASAIRPLARFYTSPGFADELMHVYLATGLQKASQQLEAGENIVVEILAREEALRLIDTGELEDGKSIAGLLMLERSRQRRPATGQARADHAAGAAAGPGRASSDVFGAGESSRPG